MLESDDPLQKLPALPSSKPRSILHGVETDGGTGGTGNEKKGHKGLQGKDGSGSGGTDTKEKNKPPKVKNIKVTCLSF